MASVLFLSDVQAHTLVHCVYAMSIYGLALDLPPIYRLIDLIN